VWKISTKVPVLSAGNKKQLSVCVKISAVNLTGPARSAEPPPRMKIREWRKRTEAVEWRVKFQVVKDRGLESATPFERRRTVPAGAAKNKRD